MKKEKTEKTEYYINCKCRKCGEYLSFKTMNPYYYSVGIVCGKDKHNCSNGVTDDEKIFCDTISYSKNKPLGKIINWGINMR